VHAHFVVPGGLAAAALRRAPGIRLPFVLTAHGTDVPGYNPRRFRGAHRVIRPLWRRICRSAHTLVSPSWSLRGLIAAAGAGVDARVIPNPVDTRRFRPGVKERRILVCGRLVERKGFAPLLAALREVELPGWEIEVVGDGPERPELEGLAAQLALPVRFHGWIAQADPRLAQIFGRAALFVFPSPWENLPVVLLEAMAAGCAVVSTDAPGNLEAVGEAAVRVAVGDGPGLAQAVAELAADAGARDDLGRRARARAEETFDSRVVARRYLDLLRAAAGGAP
jgi:glycosyltransferase involved in cell wall biosynthesis